MNERVLIYGASLLLILGGIVLTWQHVPYGWLLINVGFTPYVGLKIVNLLTIPRADWEWTDTVRLVLALFLAAMLTLRYLHFYHSHYYFILALFVDYIVGRQLRVRQGG